MERWNSLELEDLDSGPISSYSLNSSFLMRIKEDESVFTSSIYYKKYSAESISSINTWIPIYSHVFCK